MSVAQEADDCLLRKGFQCIRPAKYTVDLG